MNLLLTGFMGVGKSTIGRLLARRLGYCLLDTDTEIEHQQDCTIADIFRDAGRQYEINRHEAGQQFLQFWAGVGVCLRCFMHQSPTQARDR